MEPEEGTMTETPNSTDISTKFRRIAELARKAPELAFTTLAHHLTLELLTEAYRRTRKDAAVGIDGQTAADYAKNLGSNLQSLLDRVKSGTYRAPPVRRVYIPKDDGSKTRPIGIPTFEDKVLQRAVVMILEPIYEQDFVNWSYGFRPRRSALQALSKTQSTLTEMRGGWVLEVDIQSFFDELDHAHLRAFVRRRVRDGVLLRLIGKWLKAGVLEDGAIRTQSMGTPQGGVISPLLANIYLHEVFDRWFEDEVRPRLQSFAFVIRYADDIMIAFKSEADARKMMRVLPKRFGRFGLRLHPEKTRLVDFLHPRSSDRARSSGRGVDVVKPGTFDLLGFTHYWGMSRKRNWVVFQKTSRKRLARTMRRLHEWCRNNRHRPVAVQHQILSKKLRGHDAYFGITGNSKMLSRLRHEVRRVWRFWLNRRSQRARMTWERFKRLMKRFPLPSARVVHSVYRAAKP
jgi:group II intron reverse transcriptase/maturase